MTTHELMTPGEARAAGAPVARHLGASDAAGPGGDPDGHDVGRCPSCGRMAVDVDVWALGAEHQVLCNGCGAAGPRRPSRGEAVDGWRAMSDGPLTTIDELLGEAERVREGATAYGQRAPTSRVVGVGKLMDVVVAELGERRSEGWQ